MEESTNGDKQMIDESKIVFKVEEHKYFYEGTELESVTTVFKNYEKPFDLETNAKNYALKNGMEVDEVKKLWKRNNELGMKFGSNIHLVAENYTKMFHHKRHSSIEVKSQRHLDYFDAVRSFWKDNPEYQLVHTEKIVIDLENEIAGTIDLLVKDKDQYYLLDWKTNKKIDSNNPYQNYLHPISHLHKCELNTYSLQLSLYKYILEKNYGLKIDKIKLIHLTGTGYTIYDCNYLQDELQSILEDRRKNKLKKQIEEITQ